MIGEENWPRPSTFCYVTLKCRGIIDDTPRFQGYIRFNAQSLFSMHFNMLSAWLDVKVPKVGPFFTKKEWWGSYDDFHICRLYILQQSDTGCKSLSSVVIDPRPFPHTPAQKKWSHHTTYRRTSGTFYTKKEWFHSLHAREKVVDNSFPCALALVACC